MCCLCWLLRCPVTRRTRAAPLPPSSSYVVAVPHCPKAPTSASSAQRRPLPSSHASKGPSRQADLHHKPFTTPHASRSNPAASYCRSSPAITHGSRVLVAAWAPLPAVPSPELLAALLVCAVDRGGARGAQGPALLPQVH